MAKKEIYYEDINIGDEIPSLAKGPIEQIQVVRYAGASGDFNPMHTVTDVAKAAGQPGTFIHGMLSMGFMGQMITDWAPNRALKKIKARLGGMVWPGDTLTFKGKITDKHQESGENLVECEIWAENQKGESPVTGSATLVLPSKS